MINFLRPNLNIVGSSTVVRLYWIATGLFVTLFLVSIVLTLGDLEASYASYTRLGFPLWTVFFNGFAKIFGVIAILHNQSRTLKDFAFAGFLYDLLLALCAHIVLQETDVFLAVFGLVLWVFAFVMDRKVFPIQERIQTPSAV